MNRIDVIIKFNKTFNYYHLSAQKLGNNLHVFARQQTMSQTTR